MKSKKIILAFLPIGLLAAVGCRKPEEPKPDYREKWVGTYECEEVYSWGYGTSEDFDSGTNVYQTNVVVMAKGDSLLQLIENRNSVSYEVKISRDGKFGEGFGYRKYISGIFFTDSLYIYILHSQSPAGSSTSDCNCRKLKN